MNGRRTLAGLTALATLAVMAASVHWAKTGVSKAYRLMTASHTAKMKALLQRATDDHLAALEDLAGGLGASTPVYDEVFQELAERASARAPAFAAINFLDDRLVETFLYPYGANRSLEGLDLKTRMDALPAARRAEEKRRPSATELVPLAQGGEGFLAYAPVNHRDTWGGLVEGALDKESFARRYAAAAVPPKHDLSLLAESGDEPFYETAPSGGSFQPYDYYFTLRFADRRWWAVLRPRFSPSPLLPLSLLLLLELAVGALVVRRLLRRS